MNRLQRIAAFALTGATTAALLGMAGGVSAHDDNTVDARLKGYREVPSVSTAASGRFRAVIDDANGLVHYELTFAGLESPVRMAHIHLAQRGVNGGIVLWLCQTVAPFVAPAPRVSPTCPQTGTVTGTLSATDVITQTTQGIAAGEIAEVIAAIRAGVAYVNVHTDGSPGGEIRGQLKED